MSRELVVGRHVINDASDAYVIAEIGHNHQGSVETAKEMFRQAKACGVSAVKLQKRDNRHLYTKAMYAKPYDHENSFGATYGEHREALEFGPAEYRELRAYAAEIALDFFATAFDVPSADMLADLEVPAFKMASADLTNIPLLTHVARLGKPMFVSTGAATMQDVERAYEAVMPLNSRLSLMQCTCGYPADYAELDLRVIETYRERFPDLVIGYSGHDNGVSMPIVAYVLGARAIEKHFTLNRAMKGTDHVFSLEPVGMRKMTRDLTRTRAALGDARKKAYASEAGPALKMGKTLVAAHDLPAGHRMTRDDVAIKSPGDGVRPYELDRVVGAVTTAPLREDDPLTIDQLEQVGAGDAPVGSARSGTL